MTRNNFPIWRKSSVGQGPAFIEQDNKLFDDDGSIKEGPASFQITTETVSKRICGPICTKFKRGGPARSGPYCFVNCKSVTQGDECITGGGPFINAERSG
jgi:hypothetical protein